LPADLDVGSDSQTDIVEIRDLRRKAEEAWKRGAPRRFAFGRDDLATAARATRYHYGQELLAVAENAGVRYYHQDALGSTTQLSDDAGLAAVDYKYGPFGNVRSEAGDPTDNRQTYTGQEYDEHYYGARYYDPVIRRFLTQDSVLGDVGTPASLHRYLYAYSNPLRYTDPSGHIALLKQGVEMFETTDKFLSEDAKKTMGVGDLALNIGSRFALKLFGSALSAANFVANSVVYATPLAMTSLGEDAREEFHESYEGAKTTIAAVQELHAKGNSARPSPRRPRRAEPRW
jgi:RHS repeat-associated protein